MSSTTGKTIRVLCGNLFREYPAGAILLAVIAPAVFLVPFPDVPFGFGVIASCALALAAWCAAGVTDALYRFAVPGLVMLLAIFFMRSSGLEDPILEFSGPAERARMCLELESVDPSCGEPLGNPKNMICRVRSAWWPGDAENRTYFKRSVLASVNFGAEVSEPHIGFGDVFEAEGVLSSPQRPLLDCEFDYAAYLEHNGVKHVFRIDSMGNVKRGYGVRRTLFDLRGRMLSCVTERLETDDEKSLACGLFFGMRQGITRDTKNDFLRSGAVHILTVSGTHIGFFLMFVLLALRFVPFRLRYVAAVCLAGVYALSTGMEPPAFRAFVMAAFVLLLRACLYRTDTLNSLFLACAALLVFNPSNLVSAGFQYSFITVAVLLIANGRLKAAAVFYRPSEAWLVPKFTPKLRIRFIIFRNRYFIAGTGACVVAFLASLPIGMYYQNILPTGAAAANFVLIPVASGAFIVFFAAVLFAWIPFAASFLTGILSLLLKFMLEVCDVFADTAFTAFAAVPWWFVAAFLIALFTAISPLNGKIRSAAIACMALLMTFACLRVHFLERETLVMYGGGTETPCAVVTDPETASACVVNLPDFESAMSVEAFLVSRGITRCVLFVSGGAKKYYGGLEYFTFPVSKIAAKKRVIEKSGAGEKSFTLETDGEYSDGRLHFTFARDMFTLETPRGRLSVRENPDGGCETVFPCGEKVLFPQSSVRRGVIKENHRR